MSSLRTKLHLTESIISCTRCPLSADHHPVPGVIPRSRDARLVVIGDTPTIHESRLGTPFRDSAGKMLRRAIRDSFLDEDDVAFVNVVSCPDPSPGALADEYAAACRVNLRAQLAACNARCGLILGGQALHVFRHDLAITKVDGLVFEFAEFNLRAMVVRHPINLIRTQDQVGKQQWRDQVEFWCHCVFFNTDIGNLAASRYCVSCGVGNQSGRDVHVVDRDGAGYCYKHRQDSKALSVESKWRKFDNKRLQGAML